MRKRWAGCLGAMGVAALMCGCVPVPYRPSAAVSHVPIKAEEGAAITLSSGRYTARLGSLAKSIQRAEPRVVLIDGSQYLNSVLTGGRGTLSDLLAASRAVEPRQPGADYLLSVGAPLHRQLHDTGMAAPFPYLPVFWAGYEKTQSLETLAASLVDLSNPQAADALWVTSAYTEVTVALAYGISTVAMPESAVRKALSEDVAHRLARAHPTGTIRLVLVSQEGGAAEASAAGAQTSRTTAVVHATGPSPTP